MEYKIFEDNMPKLEKKLATIQKNVQNMARRLNTR